MDEPVDRASLVFSARLTIDAHGPRRRGCQCCTADGCAQLDWAKHTDPDYYAAQTTPASRPAA